jgi:hypothetical protein
VIPTFFLYLFAVYFVVGGVGALGMLLWTTVAETHRLTREPIVAATILACVLAVTLAGWLLILAARACWRAGKGDWRRVAVFTVFGFTLCALALFFEWIVLSH